jgi:hypothetical protein
MKAFKIPKINFLDPAVFNKHRRDISTHYYFALDHARARLNTQLQVLQQEYDDYLYQIRQVLNTVEEVPFARHRFVVHNILGCHCKFCSTWTHHRCFRYRLQEVRDKRKNAYDQYDSDWKYIDGLRTKQKQALERLRDMQLAKKVPLIN